ncbi:twin-arginine translocation pathway signal [Mycolicibacterium bacteremicum]|uniref:twin-arginine translocation pathway signal n=1 Tax=Mycolicibacterium bacteremicum TaxID=564198 RepID=UPI0026F2BA27|nr:twin-arginine translocation pathway signal [Mycolicibacterium bacteremicum]
MTAGPVQRVRRTLRRFWVAIVLVVLLSVAGGVTGWLYQTQYRPDQATGGTAADAAVKAASDGTIALLSYSPENLETDFTNARSHLTGDFLNYYNQFTEQIVSPAAKKNAVTTSASVVNAAVSELHPDRAVVLVFLNQSTTSTDNPDGSFSTSSVKVGLAKVDGAWRIAAFDPV